jgi:hypothetical protein
MLLTGPKMELSLMPSFVKDYLETRKLEPEKWCELDEAIRKATIAKQLETTKTLEEAEVMCKFWKKNYYDALHSYEAITRPFNGWPDEERTAELNKPMVRFHINLTEAYATRPSYEYMAARTILEMFRAK